MRCEVESEAKRLLFQVATRHCAKCHRGFFNHRTTRKLMSEWMGRLEREWNSTLEVETVDCPDCTFAEGPAAKARQTEFVMYDPDSFNAIPRPEPQTHTLRTTFRGVFVLRSE